MKFRVLGKHVNGNFFDIEVSAPNGLAAFGAAALLLQEAEEDEDAEFFVAIPCGTAYEFPGEGVVTLETVLDPEQAFVFGLAGQASSEGAQEVHRTAIPAEELPELKGVIDRMADSRTFNSDVEVAPMFVAGQIQAFSDQQIQDVAMALGATKVFTAVREMLHVYVPEEAVVVALETVEREYARVVAQRSAGAPR